jgi:molecular chaperone HscC
MIELKPLIAIDLGTSNSLVGIFKDGQSRLIENPYGAKLTPLLLQWMNKDKY